MDECGATLLPLKEGVIDALVKADPAFAAVSLPADIYQGEAEQNGKRLPTVGLRAVLVTTSRLSDDQAYAVVKAVFTGLTPLKGMHPAFADLDRRHMAHDALVAPLHEGAKRYYRESGLP
jgi:TRAP transporter TAXI family solute receptor